MKTASPSWLQKQNNPPVKEEGAFDYHGAEWRNDADAHKAAFPYCAHCLKEDKFTPGRFSDHIISIRNGGDVWNWKNRQNLCKYHDDVKRSEESRGIIPPYVGEWGKRLPIDV